MSQKSLTFKVQVEPIAGLSGQWSSAAFKLPGVRLVRAQRPDGSSADELTINEGKLTTSVLAEAFTTATIEVPDDLVTRGKLEEQKFDLEQERLRNEQANQKRTFVWSIGSALLSAAVALVISFNAKPNSSLTVAGPALDAVEGCRSSIKRLSLLARTPTQTVQTLADAIDRNEAACDDVLVKAMGAR